MMSSKKSRGLTLVELIVSIALLAVVTAAVGSAMYSASQSYALTRKMQEDEYNARLALLSITREVHRGTTEVEANGNILRLLSHDGETEITYTFDSTTKILSREVSGGDTPVQFAETELDTFTALLSPDGKRLTLETDGLHGLKLKTTVAIFRVPPSDESGDPE